MHALPIVIAVLCAMAVAYRYYSAFLAAKVAVLDDSRTTPAHLLNDGHNYLPTNRWILFGHHFAAIAGAGPLIGPVLAVQFGYMPGLLWLVIGVCVAGATQDFLVLAASVRHKGQSLAQIAREQVGALSGATSTAAIAFIIVVALAGLGSVVVKALGGEELKMGAGTGFTLPAGTNALPGVTPLVFTLPAGTLVSVPGRQPGEPFSAYPLARPQALEVTAPADAASVARGGEIRLSGPAHLLIPGSAWGLFTIGCSIPIALLMGLWTHVFRKKTRYRIVESSVLGVGLLLLCVVLGARVPGTALGACLNLNSRQLVVAMGVYGFVASILPVWLLLVPRDYLSSYLKIGTIAALLVGVMLVNPRLELPAFDQIWAGKGPNVQGQLFPFLFITIMCGAISGFHALVSSGTTSKMLNKESDARMIGYGAMLMEGLVGVVALLAAASLSPGDYYAIQIPIESHAARLGTLRLIDGDHDNLQNYEVQVEENLRRRTGGAVTLAVGMSKIFSNVSFLRSLVKYWYHFAIMFEALFILTTIDAGTRILRFLLQEIMGKIRPDLGRVNWWPGAIIATSVGVLAWGWLLWSNDVLTIWPMCGIANQLLAVVALSVMTTVMVNAGRRRYMWVTLPPLAFIVCTTMTAGVEMIFGRFGPAASLDAAGRGALINATLTALMLVCVVIIVLDNARAWLRGPLKEVASDKWLVARKSGK